MHENIHDLRTIVAGLLLELETGFPPGDTHARDAAKHATRLRFSLARAEEQAHAAVMQSPLHTPERRAVAEAILGADIERAQAFVRAAFPKMSGSRRMRVAMVEQAAEAEEKLAA